MKTEIKKTTYINFIKEQKRIQSKAKNQKLSDNDKIFVRHWNLAYRIIKNGNFKSILNSENPLKTKKQVHICIIAELCQKYEILIDNNSLLEFYKEYYKEEVYKYTSSEDASLSFMEKYVLEHNIFKKD